MQLEIALPSNSKCGKNIYIQQIVGKQEEFLIIR